MLKSHKDISTSSKVDITQEFLKAAINFQDAIKKSGISTWHDHIPELQMLVTFTLQLKFYPNQIMANPKKNLEDVTEWCSKLGTYFLSSKDLKNPEQIQYSLTSLLEIANLIIQNYDFLPRGFSKPETNTVSLKDRDLTLYKSKTTRDKYKAFSSSSEAVPTTISPELYDPSVKENFLGGLFKKCMCGR